MSGNSSASNFRDPLVWVPVSCGYRPVNIDVREGTHNGFAQ